MEERIIRRLEFLGYTEVSGSDKGLILCIFRKLEQEVLNYCNLQAVPEELEASLVENACGEFLMMKKLGGEVLGLDLEGCVTSLSEGDISISFDAASSPEKQLDLVIGFLSGYGRDSWNRFRRVRW